MHLKQMFMKLIEPSSLYHSSIKNIPMVIPHAPILSDPRSFENLIVLLNLIKKFDSKFWARGEIFASVIFGCYAAQLSYIFLQVVILRIDLFDIGKWDPKTDDSKMIQLFIATSGINFMICTVIILQILVYGAETNLIETRLIEKLHDEKMKLIRMQNFTDADFVFINRGRI